MEWFLCDNKMPDNDRKVIICTDTAVSTDRGFMDIGCCFGKSWRDAEGWQLSEEIGKVAKWAEIPETGSAVWKQDSNITIKEDVLVRIENLEDSSAAYYVAHKMGSHVWQSVQGHMIDIHGRSVCYCLLVD